MSKAENKPFLRKILVLNYIEKLVKGNPGQVTFYVGVHDFEKYSPLLKDEKSIMISLNKISENTDHNITIGTELQKHKIAMKTATMTLDEEVYFKTVISIHVEDIEEFGVYCRKFGKSSNKKKISIIELFKDKDDQLKIIVNKNYKDKDILSVNMMDKSWEILFRIGEGEKFTIDQEGCKSLYDYVNSNNKCALYSNTNYILTKILSIREGKLVSNINIETITNKAYKQRIINT